MTRRYDDPVEVREASGAPELFVWRGRLYRVRAVLSRWSQARPWWREVARRASGAADTGAAGGDGPVRGDGPAGGDGAVRGDGAAGGDGPVRGESAVGGRPGSLARLTCDRVFWRVEASPGRAARTGVFDLAVEAGRWTLVAVSD